MEEIAVVMVPLPAQGHLNQLLHLSHRISAHGLPVHFVGTPVHNRQAQVRLHGWDPQATSKIHFHDFSTTFPSPPPNPNSTNKHPVQLLPSFYATVHLREPICELVKKLSITSKRVVVIHDSLMRYAIQDVETIPNAESYCFHTPSALAMYTYYWQRAGKLVTVNGEAIDDVLRGGATARLPQELAQFFQMQAEFSKKRNWGNLYNTNRAIDGEYLNLIAREEPFAAEKHWAIGPFNPTDIISQKNRASDKKRHKCLDWLDKQPANSVIFISFGSTTSLCDKQVEEIAIGLDKSGVKFIWVLRDADRADVFAGESRRANLPDGFEDRITKSGKGMIVRDWAPQLEILGHSSTGGFMTHCGWNSCIESISFGVPMAAWPMHSDQPRNAILVTKHLKTGVRVGEWGHDGELVNANEVEKAIKRLMDSGEGDEMRMRAAAIRDAIRKSVEKDDEDDTTRTEMDAFISHLTR
ncbi:OLC1v1034560C1 [Oldenlandia corymbosa var. corymbosa]|uniref:Glycosyltransferase n=1 Tax=Oldenlandia corymbosa var. corymbosa TaxID=529605 RepID=A0AAV1CS65_OLDCO|nr:OLC1v1034560C1 [Oldenlandia corymbosa var. corymbosa]